MICRIFVTNTAKVQGSLCFSSLPCMKSILSCRRQALSQIRAQFNSHSKQKLSDISVKKPFLQNNFTPLIRKQTNSNLSLRNLLHTSFSKCSKHSCVIFPCVTSGLIIGSGLYTLTRLYDCSVFITTAQCKSKQKSRTRLAHDKDEVSNPDFDWKLFLKLLWKDIFILLGAVVAAIGAAVVNIQIPVLLGEITNIVSKYASNLTSEVSNFFAEVNKPAIKLSLIYGLQGLLTFSYVSLLSIVGENMAANLRMSLFQSLLHQDMKFFDAHKTGELVDRLTSDVQDFKSSFKLTISQGLKAITQTIGCTVSLYMISPKLTLIMMGVIPLVIVGGTTLGALLRKLSRDAQEQISKSTAVADEAIGNVRTVRAFAMEDKELEIYDSQVNEARMKNIQLGVGIGAFQGASNIFLNGIVLGSLYAGGWLISTREMKAGDLISFLVATQMIERSMAQLSLLLGHVVRGVSAGARVFEYINTTPEIPLKGGQTIPYHSMFGDIEFSHVKFHYPTRPEQEVLTDFNLKVPGGKMVALVGLSGGGKSTVAVLLERFYDTTGGKVTIDGIDVKQLDPCWLRGKAVGFINQEPVLFATSVMENIRYGRPDATDEEVMEAAKLANADNFIRSFPASYNTILGERGVTVSGGQKQRIAIARALIKNPSILILDEATSALDAESERVVQQALDHVVKGRTVLVIAHRLSTIRDADVIAVVSKGRIVEVGNHNQLKARKGIYWELIKKQELEDELQHS